MLIQLVVSAPTYADQEDTLSAVAGARYLYDSNLFRLSSAVDPLAVIGNPNRSDSLLSLFAGVKLDKKYSNQRVMFTADVNSTRYSRFKFLDYQNTNYKGVWSWQIGSKLTGSANVSRNQSLSSFSDTQIYLRNLNTVDSRHLDLDWWLHANWHLFGSASFDETSNSVFNTTNLSSRSRFVEYGVKYVAADTSYVALLSRNLTGDYANVIPNPVLLLDSGYTERQQELKVNWQFTVKSLLSGYLLHINRTHPRFAQRDFNIVVGGMALRWDPTDKTHVNVSVKRGAGSWWDIGSSYYINDTVSVGPVWEISPALTARLTVERGRKDYRGAIVPILLARKDVTQSLMLDLDWIPRRNLMLTTSLQQSRRSSNFATFDYKDYSWMVSGQLGF
ncbi:MAG TPA: XrtB/PEP-CTERM-associated polysaccharide biosynthesis outer membrane protein EpsL [Gallionella sp.]|nr:XrtB/PEP-CTERM-associated polysaccharide biosynthesis outer membrane protein EpsL [Gallionella sp.]